MSSLDDYTKAVRSIQNAKADKKEHPKGWEPGVVLDGGKSYVSSGPVKSKKEASKKWDEYIELLGFSPEEFEIMEPVHVRTWTTQTSEGIQQMFYYKADIRSRKHIENDKDFDKLVAEIKKAKKPARKVKTKENGSMVVCLSDWQLGKRDGDGTEGIIKLSLIHI